MAKERYGGDDKVDGGETVGNSWSDTEATRRWTEGKLLGIAWGELRWEGAIRE